MSRNQKKTKKGVGALSAVVLGLGTVAALNMAAFADQPLDGYTTATAINADAIELGHITKWADIESISSTTDTEGGARVTGYAVLLDASTAAVNGGGVNTAVPTGTPIYLQWVTKTGQVSPIYKAKTYDDYSSAPHDGAYAFSLPPFVDAYGEKHFFLPGIAYKPRVKVWFEPYEDPYTGEMVVPIRDTSAGGNPTFSATNAAATSPTGAQRLDLQYINNYVLWGYQMPSPLMTTAESKWIESKGTHAKYLTQMDNASLNGKVWLEGRGSLVNSGPAYNPTADGDVLAEGYKVVFSALDPDCVPQLETIRDTYADGSVERNKAMM